MEHFVTLTQMFRWVVAALTIVPALGWSRCARATIADWRINEAQTGLGGFVELYVPPNTFANCLFPTSRLDVYSGTGDWIAAIAPFHSTVCYAANSYFLLPFDGIPTDSGQLCLTSSQTRYDCVRWGPITSAVRFLRNLDDATTAPVPPLGRTLARMRDTGVVADDFVLGPPTPGGANDGSNPTPPDGGSRADAPRGFDAPADSRGADARNVVIVDAVPPFADVNLNPRFLSADPGGGACQCRTARAGTPPVLSTIMLAVLLWFRRSAASRKKARPPA